MGGFIGGLIGAAASAAGWLAIEHTQQTSLGWMVILVGLVTGFCVHKGSSVTSVGFTRGALAIILTLAAIVGGRQAYAKIMQANASSAQEAVVVSEPQDDAPADDEGEDSGETAPAPVLPQETPDLVGLGQRNYTKSAMKKNMSDRDMIWLCVAALAAYLTGKGGDKAPSVESEEVADSPEPATGNENDDE